MSIQPSQFQAEEATSFEDEAGFDVTHEYRDGMIPTSEFYGKRNDIDVKTKEAMALAAQNGFVNKDYATEGIDQLEHYANNANSYVEQGLSELEQYVRDAARVGEMLVYVRNNETQ